MWSADGLFVIGLTPVGRATIEALALNRMIQSHIPMSSPDITTAEIEAVTRVLQTPHLSIGPCIDEFEERFAAYACPEPCPELRRRAGRRVGARHAVAVSSGTTGLHLCVIAAGVGEGDLVITTPFSFVASANVILYERAIPSRPYFTPIHLQPFYRERFGYREGDFPVTEAVAHSVLALPFSSVMTEEQVEYVCENLVAVLESPP